MRLEDEIALLRAEIGNRERTSQRRSDDAPCPGPSQETAEAPQDIETLLDMLNATLDDFSEELERYPKMTAIAALGVGLAIGLVIGRQLR